VIPPSDWLAIDWVLAAVAGWIAIGAAGVLRPHSFYVVARVLFPLGAALCLLVAGAAAFALFDGAETAVLPLGLPGLPFHLRLDALSAFFLMLLGSASAGVSVFAAGYFRQGEGTPPGLLCLLYHLFLASMAMVLLADDAYVFMVMWELMALSSFFLVTANHTIPAIRRAGYLYLLVAHIGALAILLAFGVLQANTGDYTFDNMRAQSLTPFWASVAFLLAFLGFGAKAGILPLHVWLPEAHPAAPSPVSALMSGVMLKTAGLVPTVSFGPRHTKRRAMKNTVAVLRGGNEHEVLVVCACEHPELRRPGPRSVHSPSPSAALSLPRPPRALPYDSHGRRTPRSRPSPGRFHASRPPRSLPA
jgi:formate hydrogenlyase subunit 3/multisubunit Na+/H+ antiporter MnhD subunit